MKDSLRQLATWFQHDGRCSNLIQNLYAAPFFIMLWFIGGVIVGAVFL